MRKQAKMARNMFWMSGVLWVLEAIGELFGGYVEDFASFSDYLAEAAFGLSFLTTFAGALYLVKDRFGGSGKKHGWTGKIGLFFLGLSGFLMTAKAVTNLVYHAFIGERMLFAEEGILNTLFLVGILASLIGVIVYGISAWISKSLPWWAALLFILSLPFVFVPGFGKYLAALTYVLVGVISLNRQELVPPVTNKVMANK